MIIIATQHVQKSYGADPVLRDVTLEIKAGERVGIVGPNGAGKTTLFKLLAGLEQPDTGEVFRAKGIRWAYLPQTPQYPPEWTARDVIASAFGDVLAIQEEMRSLEREMSCVGEADRELERLIGRYQALQSEFERLDGYQWEARMAQVTDGLGLSEGFLSTPFARLSGGEQTKTGLAKLLCQQSDVLLLDEPTNHLDLEAMEWLEGFLRDYPGTVLLISHDRCFLDAVVSSIYHLDGGVAEHYIGNYSAFVKEREERLLRQFAEYQEQQKKIKKMQEAIKRLKEWGNRSNPPNEAFHRRAKSMEKALDRLERIERPRLEAERMGLAFHKAERSGEEVLVAEGVSKSFGEKRLFDGASLLLRYGERKALLGPNGCGKSTWIKMMVGELPPDEGAVRIGSRVKLGYLSQRALEGDQERRVIDVFRETAAVSEAEARHRLAKFLFYGEQVFKRIGQLSGGERMRLRLAQLMHQDVNLLVLDEPTNHLDIEARETLEEALAGFQGSLLIVSHDRYFLQKMVDGVYWVENGRLVHDEGTFEEAWEKRRQRRSGAGSRTAENTRKAGEPLQSEKRPHAETMPHTMKPAGSGPDAASSRKRPNPYKLAELERAIAEREARRDEVMALLSGGETDYRKLIGWQQELERLTEEIDALYREWMERQES
ncbi:ABC-F type ribosomal protection protein [Brevibacillus sp. LEMMJ03]|uniref:ribosomal protection-like ABC-F family protein n=1 Tax=Brevibacillus sp. LEMMJ03 TaxID=2595056 RepID=UPI0011811ECA|nr:ABC-F type ribosomal protection protein [Brevibacillus sp. LEMMJ03]TRY27078.1 ABC-F type ribosomal protection protein [Brevibacillus sp. LEMMJ03]